MKAATEFLKKVEVRPNKVIYSHGSAAELADARARHAVLVLSLSTRT